MERKLKEYYYRKQLKHEIQDVEIACNKLNIFSNNDDIKDEVIQKDFARCTCQLELSLASLCIIIRKMVENQFTTIPYEIRRDINSIIHSNRFELLENQQLRVYSQKGEEYVSIKQLLDFARKI